MKQENLKKLASLIANYVDHLYEDYNDSGTAYYASRAFLDKIVDYTEREYTEEKKQDLYWQTVHALNDGCEEAQESAFHTRLKALCSGDDELAEKIEYLHEVL